MMALSVDEEERYEHLAAEAAREANYHDKEALRPCRLCQDYHKHRANEARSQARYYRRIARQQDG